MGLLTKFGDDVRNRASQQVAGWVVPKGRHALRVNNLVSGYTLVVFLAAMLLVGVFAGKGMTSLFVLIAAVMAVSKAAKGHIIPVLYDNLAPRFGWPSWEEGWTQDRVELGEVAPTQVAQAPSPAPTTAPAPIEKAIPEDPRTGMLPPEHFKVLAAWAQLDQERRKARALDVVSFLKNAPDTDDSLEVDETLPEEARKTYAVGILRMLAKTENIQLAS